MLPARGRVNHTSTWVDIERMDRHAIGAVLGLAFLIGVGTFVRHQYRTVMTEATSKPKPIFPQRPPEESRKKCVLCGGTGRSTMFTFGGPNSSRQPQPCPTCRGTGWVDNPLFGH